MTREEAIEVFEGLKRAYDDNPAMGVYDGALCRSGIKAILDAYVTLRPQPDPDTGLMPCGCGGKAMHMVWPDENFPNGLRLYVICGECMTETSGFNETKENAANRWNRAMGWRAEE